jgi:putative oxidoreductase
MNGIEITPAVDLVLLVFRCTLGVMIFLHGYNHLWGSGGVAGTAGWFESLGFRPAKVHALMSGLVELAVAAGLILGLLTPVACAALIGTMVVAGWAAHRPNGFFIFRDGYEYVLIVAVSAVALATFGPGTLSLDSVLGLADYGDPAAPGLLGATGALVAAVGGLLGGALLLAFGWRQVRPAPALDVEESV